MLSLGGRSWCSLCSRLHIFGLAAPGSSSGDPRAARRVLWDAPGALRGLLLGIPEGPWAVFLRSVGTFPGPPVILEAD